MQGSSEFVCKQCHAFDESGSVFTPEKGGWSFGIRGWKIPMYKNERASGIAVVQSPLDRGRPSLLFFFDLFLFLVLVSLFSFWFISFRLDIDL